MLLSGKHLSAIEDDGSVPEYVDGVNDVGAFRQNRAGAVDRLSKLEGISSDVSCYNGGDIVLSIK